MPIIDESHIDYARKFLSVTTAQQISNLNNSFYYKTPPNDANLPTKNFRPISPGLKSSKVFNSAPSLLQVYDDNNCHEDKCLVTKFAKQVICS